MPCYITGSAEGDANLAYQELSTEATRTTRLLCELCEWCDSNNFAMPNSVKNWWRAHKKKDAQRRSIEAKERRIELTKKQALRKLSDSERRALGV